MTLKVPNPSHCSASSVFSGVPLSPALLTEQWHTENLTSAVKLARTRQIDQPERRRGRIK